MDSTQIAWLLGWGSCAFCLYFTLTCATVFAKNDVGLFLALSIYAGQWGVLLVYYGFVPVDNYSGCEPHLPEFLPALSGYFCAIVGSIIYRNLHDETLTESKHLMQREGVAIYLLLLIALPKVFDHPQVVKLTGEFGHEDVEVLVTLILKLVGFFSMGKAINIASITKFRKIAVFLILAVYWLLELSYTITWLYYKHFVNENKIVMDSSYLYGFAIIKILTVIMFITSILQSDIDYRKLTYTDKLMRFFHMPHGNSN